MKILILKNLTRAQGQSTRACFWSGFAASGFSVGSRGYGNIGTRTAMMAAAGTVSQATGGKFANGAMTGAFIHLFNAWGGFRKLGGDIPIIGRRGSMADTDNLMIAHEGFILNDKTVIGFFGDSVIRVDTGYSASDYSQLKYYDDNNVLQQAIGSIGSIGKYNLFNNNCQTWADRVDSEYNRIQGQ